MEINNAHDKIFRGMYFIKQIAMAHVQFFVDKQITKGLNYDQFRLETTTYLDEQLKEHFSDIVYSCQYQDNKPAKIVFLFEHKSYWDEHTLIQIGLYLFKILEQHLKQKEKLPVVIPIVVYHGKEGWKHRTIADYYEHLPPFAKHFLPHFEIILTDLSSYSDDFLLKLLGDKLLLNALLTLKHGRDREYVLTHFRRLMTNLSSNLEDYWSRKLFQIICVYLSAVSKISQAKMSLLIHNLSEKSNNLSLHLLDNLKAKNPMELLDVEIELIKERSLRTEIEQRWRESEQRWKEAEQNRKKAEQNRKKAEQNRKKAEQLRKKEEQKTKKTILTLSKKYKFAPNEIASITKQSIPFVEKILNENNDFM